MDRIGVLGCGLMGSGIVEMCLRSGVAVTVVEATDEALSHGRRRLEASLERAVQSARISPEEARDAQGRLRFSTELADLADIPLVIEAIAENETAKLDLFRRLDQTLTDPRAILASNTSSIPIATLAAATSRPSQVIGLHFFNPVPVMKLVEVTPSLLTDEDTVERARDFAQRLGKTPIVSPDRAGFVVNFLLIPFLLSAIRMVEAGVATPDDIDTGMTLGCAHPMGPLRLVDLIGLDTTAAIAESLYAEFRETQYATPALLARMVAAGHLGRKSGRGFYEYGSSATTSTTSAT